LWRRPCSGNGPSYEELNKQYYSNPTIGVALMLQSLILSSWKNPKNED
jgi:hypothetical protein